ncbi:hypothetical protein T265_11468 [Opisthorchis viverrini]|uniref:Uncharacterized protein n=1 Tax=Opisthorchis viverrini TaxID=6198 RepID=A0A074Z9C8_OPIVI|nr:hypothetical protein T265_11468 [Opisthorchis viverrini]KER19855.1 hypothetical protein T265_11468 [Opisthorchis viverrini]
MLLSLLARLWAFRRHQSSAKMFTSSYVRIQTQPACAELISSAYPMVMPGFESETSDIRGERVTTTPPTQIPRFKSRHGHWITVLNNYARKGGRLLKRESKQVWGAFTDVLDLNTKWFFAKMG